MRFFAAALVFLFLTGTAFAKPNKGPFKKIAVIKLQEEAGESIDDSVKVSVLRRLEQARAWGADCVILDIESYGGYVHSSIETGDELYTFGRDVHTIAYVGRKAISGAAMLSLSCQEVVMNGVAKIGDSQAVTMGADGQMHEAPEKIQTGVATAFRVYARGNGYPVPVVLAMVRAQMEVIRYKVREPGDGPEWRYFRSDTPDGLPTRRQSEEWGLEEPPETVVREGELATFTAEEAIKYGLCSRLEPTLEKLIESIRAPEAQVSYLDWSWSERVSRTLLDYRVLLFLVGAAALYFSLKMPGTGVPEVLAILCFGLFFGASAIAGFAGTIELVLFFLGLLLIAVELFVLPGFGVAGFAGLVCILFSIGLAALPEGTGDLPKPATELLFDMARDFLGAALGAMVLVFFVARYLPSVPFFNRLSLAPAAVQTGSAVAPSTRAGAADALVGAIGVAETQLRPAGTARINGERRDVVTEGAFIDAGAPVRVVSVQGNAIVVRAVDPA